MGGIEVVKIDVEPEVIPLMFLLNPGDELLSCDALIFGTQHYGRAVCIIGADIDALMALHLHHSHPDVRLYGFHQVAKMYRAVGVRQCAGYQDPSLAHSSFSL